MIGIAVLPLATQLFTHQGSRREAFLLCDRFVRYNRLWTKIMFPRPGFLLALIFHPGFAKRQLYRPAEVPRAGPAAQGSPIDVFVISPL